MTPSALLECRSNTDSVGSHSDVSGHTVQAGSHTSSNVMQRPIMDVVIVIDVCQSDHLAHRKKALEEVRHACMQVGANLNHIQVSFNIFHLSLYFMPLHVCTKPNNVTLAHFKEIITRTVCVVVVEMYFKISSAVEVSFIEYSIKQVQILYKNIGTYLNSYLHKYKKVRL